MIAFVTTCKSRAQHLRRTLPQNIADNETFAHLKFIVLDYGSPDDTLSYMRSEWSHLIDSGRVVVYSYRYEGPFHMAHAKNMAHRCGILEGADVLVFGIWIESPFLISMCAVGILAPQALWVADFLSTLVGLSLIGITDYMFNHENSFVSARAVAISWLVAILAGLSRLGAGVRPARIAGVGSSSLGAAAGVFLFHATT